MIKSFLKYVLASVLLITLVIDCSSPTKSKKATQVVIRDIWFTDLVDDDGDNFLSYARLNFDLDTNIESIEVLVKLWVRYADPTDTEDYTLYFASASFVVNGNNDSGDARYIDIGAPNTELDQDLYDFALEVYPGNNSEGDVVAVATFNEYPALGEYPFEPYSEDQLPFEITFTNPLFTDIYIEVEDHPSRYIEPDDEYKFYFETNPGTVDLYAETSGATTEGAQIGLKITWEKTYNVVGLTEMTKNLTTESDYFFIYLKNDGPHDLHNFYVNYGNSAYQTFDDIYIQGDGRTYRIGYYKAFQNTQVRAWWYNESTYAYWDQGTHYTIPFTNNQSVVLWNNTSAKSEPGLQPPFDTQSSSQPIAVTKILQNRVITDPENNLAGVEWMPFEEEQAEMLETPEPVEHFELDELGYSSTSGQRQVIKKVQPMQNQSRRDLKRLLNNHR